MGVWPSPRRTRSEGAGHNSAAARLLSMKPSKSVKPTIVKPLSLSVETLRAVVGGASNKGEVGTKR